WPLDHEFWNDGLYFHSKDPWAIEPDVRTGINCVLILSRVQEEFQLIAQELARAVGWATEYYDRCKLTIQELNQRELYSLNPGRNYTISYFQKQWKHQQTFRADHTDGEQDRRDKLIKIYEHEGTLTTLRERLLDPELHLLPEKDIKKIIKSIEKVAAKLKADAEGVENLPSGDEN
ncbi:hypothetical protein PSTG_18502, partial [Puccinia striiformis f. sp. tritici PST-78]